MHNLDAFLTFAVVFLIFKQTKMFNIDSTYLLYKKVINIFSKLFEQDSE